MYERSAIVLERYFDNLLDYRRECNLRDNYNNYCELVKKLEKYQINYQKELEAIQEYNKSLDKIKKIQLEQKSLYKKSAKLEYNRNLLFNNIDGKVEEIKKCIEKIEKDVEHNNAAMLETKESLLEVLKEYNEKKFELSKCKRYKKMAENDYNEIYEISRTNFEGITQETLAEVKAFSKFDDENEIIETLEENGKNEKIPFNEDVIQNATKFAIDIAKKEAASYLVIYDKMNKLLTDINNGVAKINLHKKYARNEKAKVDFIYAVKDYEVQFLDYERMTVIHGRKSHNRLMSEACENFNTDIVQIDNLYELLLKEISNKATKKAYKELYNKSYLTEIKEKEEKFKKEKNRVNLNTATLINSNYWRIEGIREIYTVFYKNVSEVFGRDVAEFDIPKEFDNTNVEENANNSEDEQVEQEELEEKIPFKIDGYNDDEEDEEEDEEEQVVEKKKEKKSTKKKKAKVDEDLDENNNNEYDDLDYDDDYSYENDSDEDDEEDEEEALEYSLDPNFRLQFDESSSEEENEEEEFDIFGEKYKEIDFTESNVIAAKSKVEKEMKTEKAKAPKISEDNTEKTHQEITNNLFKEISFDQEDLPYEVEEEEAQLFDDLKKIKRKGSTSDDDENNEIVDFDLIRENNKKSGGVLKKLRKFNSNKKNSFNDDIW